MLRRSFGACKWLDIDSDLDGEAQMSLFIPKDRRSGGHSEHIFTVLLNRNWSYSVF